MDWKALVADHFGHFAPKDALNLLVAVVAAGVLGALVAGLGAGQQRAQARGSAVWAALFAAGVGLVRAQLPLALALVAAAILFRPGSASKADRQVLAAMLVIGLACGSGASIVAAALTVVLFILFRWAGSRSDESAGR